MALKPANERIWKILLKYESVVDCYNAIIGGKCEVLTVAEKKSFNNISLEKAEKIIEFCDKKDIKILTFDDEANYPRRLCEIYNPPAVLFCYGNLNYIDNSIVLAVVGTRKPSEYTIRLTQDICEHMAELGTVIVSGFAHGVDSLAHKSALKKNERTVAVLASGIDDNYPSDNAKFKRVIAKNGAVVTEYFPGTRPFPINFKQRNRIISGLSLGVLITQAGLKSGSLNTASHALSQGKDIFCVPPHDLYDDNYTGVVNLIRDGASPIFSYTDLIFEYYQNFSHKLNFINPYADFSYQSKKDFVEKITPKSEKNIIKNEVKVENEEKVDNEKIDLSALTEIEKKIVELLKNGPLRADEITIGIDKNIGETLELLTDLEMEGIIKILAGNRYCLI